jgi:hypothetical protein
MIDKKVLRFWANREYDLFALLKQAGIHNPEIGNLVYCPFHEDRLGGHRSAKIFQDALHCFSESRQYRPYDILRYLGYSDKVIEENLKQLGNPPMDVYEEIKVFDFYTPLKKRRLDFINGDVDFYKFTDEILSYVQTKTSEEAIWQEAKS